ncbi:Uncharacterized conserved protein GlcG, DUF336 family [Brevibacterium sandarakinum]|uniref:Uncharacterized conserved protein GlcG, DUF336 family n=1 Tax=Brevibacterium sandarakinum TaxID=629680 RepID=A0A1H1XBB6_BRESA|nr:heme-binding protein [Brevibacterium sandarakinum]SDT05909.1 Uncharacterized conserved protein GlcG, DUF336 family [Brevibacterium sandarakinum]
MSDVESISTISAGLAQRIIAAADDAAVAQGQLRFAIAVVDHAGALKGFVRQDGAKLNAVQVAQDKAYTAAASQMSTEQWSKALASDAVLAAGAPTGIDRLVPMGGGLPIVIDEEVVGAIGVSGGHWSEDVRVAAAGLTVFDRPRNDLNEREDL